MISATDGLNARARGLALHLLGRPELEQLTRAADPRRLAIDLQALGREVRPADASPAALDLAVRRRAALQMRILRSWAGERSDALAILFADEDRRSLRTLLRGALHGVAAETRLSGCIPTPELPERALAELARQATPAAIATLLVFWDNPFGLAILGEARRQHPDPVVLEVSLSRAFFARSLACSRSRELTEYLREAIDLENALSALVLATQPSELAAAQCFVDGGKHLDRSAFAAIAAAGDREAATRRLTRAFAGTRFAEVFARRADPAIEAALLAAVIGEQARAAIRDPLGPAPLLEYALRLRSETVDLRRIVWATVLGAPAAIVGAGLVSA